MRGGSGIIIAPGSLKQGAESECTGTADYNEQDPERTISPMPGDISPYYRSDDLCRGLSYGISGQGYFPRFRSLARFITNVLR